MRQLAVLTARSRPGALVAVAVAVLGGTALLTSTAVLAESGWRSHLPPGRFAAVDVVVAADQTYDVPEDLPVALPERRGVPAGLVARLAELRGVTAAVGDLAFPAAVLDRAGRPVPSPDPRTSGHAWSFVQLLPGGDVQGGAPARPDEVALDARTAAAAGVAVGDPVDVVAAGRTSSYRLTAVVDDPGAGVLFADPTAAELAGRTRGPRAGTVDVIGLRTAPGVAGVVAERAREVLAGHDVVVATGEARGDAVRPEAVAARSTLLLIAASLAGVLLLVVGFVVAGAMSVAVGAQRRDLALLRAVGATPAQVRRLVADQATVVTALVLLPGLVGGHLLAERLRLLLVQLAVAPPELPLTSSPLSAVAAALLVLLAVQVAARCAAWRCSRLPAVEGVARSRSESRTPSRTRTRVGVLLLATALVLSGVPLVLRTPAGAAATTLAGLCAALGLAVAGPALVRWTASRLARRLTARTDATSWLAVTSTSSSASRAASTVSALAMAVVFALTYALTSTTVMAAGAADVSGATMAQQTVTAGALGGLPTGLTEQVRGLAGVRAAVSVTTTTALWPYEELGDPAVEAAPALVLGPDAAGVLDLDVRSGSLTDLVGASVAVGRGVARSRDAQVGSRLPLVLGDGTPVTAQVVAVYDRDLGFGPVVLSRDLAAGHLSAGLDTSLLVRTDDADGGQDALRAYVAATPGLTLQATPAAGGGLRTAPPETWINLVVLAVLLGYLVLAITTRLVAGTAERRREHATLRLLGATPRQVRAVVRREAALMSAAAVVSGVALAAVPLALLSVAFLGRPVPAGPGWLLPATVLTVVAVAFLSLEVPTRRALRATPVQALAR